MPLLILPLALLVVVTIAVLTLPWTIIRRYRAGTARRLARPWVALLNACGCGVSAAIFLTASAITGIWIPGLFGYSASGLAVGCALGVLGLALVRWEKTSRHYTPNRWLVLTITAAVALRLCFGLWRAWQAWQTKSSDAFWLGESGFAGSMAAGAVVLGYYLAFWIGIWIFAKNSRGPGVA